MQCPACGALQKIGVEQCPVCEAPVSNSTPDSRQSGLNPTQSLRTHIAQTVVAATNGAQNQPPTSKLIEFPGVSRSPLPQWRKDLSERVREVQERRAREAAEEESGEKDEARSSAPQLELLPQADVAPLNPLVSAALRRIERAHSATRTMNRSTSAPASALAYAPENEYSVDSLPEFDAAFGSSEPEDYDHTLPTTEPAQPEKVHNLVVVAPQATRTETKPKPRRLIVDNDPALNYLDAVPTTLRVDVAKQDQASAFSRLLAAIVDLMVVALLCAPFAAAVELVDANWQGFRLLAIAAATFSVVSFLYLTISTALTGRTVGLRLFSLRIVDSRTGLIPTGKQSAGRALVYVASLLTLGLVALYALIDRDKRTAHDRLARTAVVGA